MRFQTLYEGRHIFAVILVLGVGGGVLGWTWLVLLAVALFIFCLNFFRDPERESPAGDDVVVAAADGVVADIEELEESELLKTKCRRVGIFLSVFDVHVNKAPIAGKIIYQRHREQDQPSPPHDPSPHAEDQDDGKDVTAFVKSLETHESRRLRRTRAGGKGASAGCPGNRQRGRMATARACRTSSRSPAPGFSARPA